MTHPALAELDHRPWPVPQRRWTWRQSWCDLLFAHWEVPVEALRPLVPAGLELDTFEGKTYLGIVPFRMEGVMRRPLPDLPGVSAFPELNVRAYVTKGGKPGVWFFSLDATQPLAVWAARRFFHLPYHRADMVLSPDGDGVAFRSARRGGGPVFQARYRPAGPVSLAAPGSLDAWLTERYCLYAQPPGGGAVKRTEVHHVQWPLQPAAAEIAELTLLEPLGLSVAGPPATLHFARRVDVVVW